MWPFGKKAKLCRAVDRLATYNDKGIDWAGHSVDEVSQCRSNSIQRIRRMVDELGGESLPPEFLVALENGDLAVDLTGRFHDLLKNHFRR